MPSKTNIVDKKDGILWKYRGSKDILFDGNRMGKRISIDVFSATENIPNKLTQDAHRFFKEYSTRSQNAIARMQDYLNKYIPERGIGFCLENIEDGFIISPESESACLLRIRFFIDKESGEVWRIVAHDWHCEAITSIKSLNEAFPELTALTA